jgi:hypothetical protein
MQTATIKAAQFLTIVAAAAHLLVIRLGSRPSHPPLAQYAVMAWRFLTL